MKVKEKRSQRAYKIPKSIYDKAVKRASKEDKNVANIVEGVLYAYAMGSASIRFQDVEEYIHPIFIKAGQA